MMLPNEIMPAVYHERVSPHLRRGHALIFSSGYNVTYRFIEAPPFVDVGLIAPRIMGAGVRERYLSGQGYGSFVSVGQDASGQTWNTVLAVARAMGALKMGAIEVTFEQETELDLFAQQTLIPAMHHLLKTAVDVLLARGYPPDAVFTELYLSGALAYYLDRAARRGLLRTLADSPLTDQYSAVSRLDRYYDLKLERQMENALQEIHNGAFAREWSKEFTDGNRRLKSFYRTQEKLELWELEQQTLDLFERGTDSSHKP
jgi:ketol-acid reductoisomerase